MFDFHSWVLGGTEIRYFFWLILKGPSLAYAIAIASYVLHRWVWIASPWWLDLADTFALYLFAPMPLLLLFGLLQRSRSTILLSAFPLVLFAFLYGELFLPGSSERREAQTVFTVMTFNIAMGNRDYPAAVQMLGKEGPDVIAIQELTPEMADALATRLSENYRYQALVPREDYGGAGVFSRFPIKKEETFTATGSGHVAQHLLVEVEGREINFFNVHPYPPLLKWMKRSGVPPLVVQDFDAESQLAEVADIMEEAEGVVGPVVITGDFNLTDQTRPYYRITREFKDAYREAGWGLGHTFPAGKSIPWLPIPGPLIRIDYIFHSPDLVALASRVGDSAGSDHHPVIATLGLLPTRNYQP